MALALLAAGSGREMNRIIKGTFALLVLPVIASIAFFLIADIDSPRGGVINVVPYNLIATSQSIKTD